MEIKKVKNKGGRPPGRKNNSTVVTEAMQGDFVKLLKTNFKEVIQAVCQRAKGEPLKDEDGKIVYEDGYIVRTGGSDAAAKLLIDKIMPNASLDDGGKGPKDLGITIVINDMKEKSIEGEIINEVSEESRD